MQSSFNPRRSPKRVATTAGFSTRCTIDKFQSTPLSEESGDTQPKDENELAEAFQSTPLSEESGDLKIAEKDRYTVAVSIHAALRREWRHESDAKIVAVCCFNPRRSPKRVATGTLIASCTPYRRFNPRRSPKRVATRGRLWYAIKIRSFNPRRSPKRVATLAVATRIGIRIR